jgi:rhodanese-related sulfurtransferase
MASAKLKLNDPGGAKEFFEKKLAFTLGPMEVDHARQQGLDFNLIDVRARNDFIEGHAPGAVNLPEDVWDSQKGLSKDKMNVIYCYSIVCHLAAKFAALGFPVMEMDGGFESWKEMELDIETGSKHAAAA